MMRPFQERMSVWTNNRRTTTVQKQVELPFCYPTSSSTQQFCTLKKHSFPSEEDPVACDLCGKTFKSARGLMVHKRVHQKDKKQKKVKTDMESQSQDDQTSDDSWEMTDEDDQSSEYEIEDEVMNRGRKRKRDFDGVSEDEMVAKIECPQDGNDQTKNRRMSRRIQLARERKENMKIDEEEGMISKVITETSEQQLDDNVKVELAETKTEAEKAEQELGTTLFIQNAKTESNSIEITSSSLSPLSVPGVLEAGLFISQPQSNPPTPEQAVPTAPSLFQAKPVTPPAIPLSSALDTSHIPPVQERKQPGQERRLARWQSDHSAVSMQLSVKFFNVLHLRFYRWWASVLRK